jgi:hypothetical protein
MALKLPKEILWKWHLRYLITKMRLETSKRPSSWQLPWGYLLHLQDKPGQHCTPPGVCFKCNQTRHWAKGCTSPCPLPGPCLQCDQNGHWRINSPSLSL